MLQIAPRPEPGRANAGIEPEIGDYAIIGDCRTAALVSRGGSIDWLCLPHFAGPSVFAALLDRKRGGCFRITPEAEFRSTRRYIGAAPVLETTFQTSSGKARLTDFLPIDDAYSGLRSMREILRIAEGVEGGVTLDVLFEPRPDYGRAPARIRSRGRLGCACAWRDELFLLRSDADLDITPEASAVAGQIHLKVGEKVCFALSYEKGEIGVISPLPAFVDDRLRATISWWKRWADACTYAGPYHEAVLRSAVTLKLMTFALSGAVVAAPTTSLPEAVGSDSNWITGTAGLEMQPSP